MLPFTISSRHSRYMSCLPINLSEMQNLQQTAPEVYCEFKAGNFTLRQTTGSFNGVWTDLALEQRYNKEGKTSLFKGITQTETAREKYIKALPCITSVSGSVKQMVHMDAPSAHHHEKKNKDDFANVLKIKQTVERIRNPFDSARQRDELMNLYSRQILAVTNLSDAKRLGLEALAVAEESNAENIISPKIETFATQIKHSKKRQDNVKQVMSEESAMTRALCFTQDLSDEARIEAFSYELLGYPPSLFDKLDRNQFAMRKRCKAS